MLANISFKLLNKCLGLKYFNKCLPKTNLTTKNKIQAAVARADTIKESGTANCEKLKLPSKYWNCSSLFIEIPIGALIGMTTNKGKTRNKNVNDNTFSESILYFCSIIEVMKIIDQTVGTANNIIYCTGLISVFMMGKKYISGVITPTTT